MSKTILVTGGAGFIGSHLARKLLALGSTVVVVDNLNNYYDPAIKKQNLSSLKQPDFHFYQLDLRFRDKLCQVFSRYKFSSVVHLAGEVGVRPSINRPADYITANIWGTYHVLELIKEFHVPQLVFGSSSSVYGNRSGKRGFLETDLPSPVSPYAATKLSAEALCQAYAKIYGIKTTVLRFFTVYGPNNRPDMACYKFTDSIEKDRAIILYGKDTRRDFTYIDDIVAGIIKAIKRPYDFELINLGNSKPEKITLLVRLIEQNLGKKAKFIYHPLPLGDVPQTFANIDKAKKLLNWQPATSFEQGIYQLTSWYSAQKKVVIIPSMLGKLKVIWERVLTGLRFIGKIQSTLLLSIAYYLVIGPVAILFQGVNIMAKRPKVNSYWQPRIEIPETEITLKRQF